LPTCGEVMSEVNGEMMQIGGVVYIIIFLIKVFFITYIIKPISYKNSTSFLYGKDRHYIGG
jgi:hypothetical protein